MDDVKEDLRRMGVTNLRIRAHRRDDWKMVVKEAKVLQGLQSHVVVVYIILYVLYVFQGRSAVTYLTTHLHLLFTCLHGVHIDKRSLLEF